MRPARSRSPGWPRPRCAAARRAGAWAVATGATFARWRSAWPLPAGRSSARRCCDGSRRPLTTSEPPRPHPGVRRALRRAPAGRRRRPPHRPPGRVRQPGRARRRPSPRRSRPRARSRGCSRRWRSAAASTSTAASGARPTSTPRPPIATGANSHGTVHEARPPRRRSPWARPGCRRLTRRPLRRSTVATRRRPSKRTPDSWMRAPELG